MSGIFSNCSTLSTLPDISKWNTNNVKNKSGIFSNCSGLSSLSDISKWNTNNTINIYNIRDMFCRCSSLSSLPDISKWNYLKINTHNNTIVNYILSGCLNIIISKAIKSILIKK